jgi:hypothetical protein
VRNPPLLGIGFVSLLLLFGGGFLTHKGSTKKTTTTTLVAANDAYVNASQPTKNFGTATTLQVDASPIVRSYLKFDLSSINGTITGATLKLTATMASKVGFDVRDVASSAWAEGTLEYANAPAVSGTMGVGPGAFASKQVLSFDVTSSITSGIRSFALVDRGSTSMLSVGSSESKTPATRPRLVVAYAPAPPPLGPCGSAPVPPSSYDHVVWIWMENKSFADVIGASSAPYETQLAAQCGLATSYHAVTHPSLPNYIAATSGGTQGIADDNAPASHPLAVASIYSQVKAAGKTWRDYEESAPGNCPLGSSGQYAVKHDPAPYYTGIRSDCALRDVPMGTTASGSFLTALTNDTLPAFSFVTPNLCSDTHDCSVATGDAWLKSWFSKILASPSYTRGRTVIFLTWDEDDGSASNRVPLVVISPSTVAGTTSATAFNHYALLRTTEQLLGIPTFLGHAGDSGTSSMAATFNLR